MEWKVSCFIMTVKSTSYLVRTMQFHMDSGVSMVMMMMMIIIVIIIIIIIIIRKSNLHLIYALYVNCIIRRGYVEIKCQLDATEVFIADLIACSTCFGQPLCPSSGAQEYYTMVAACGILCCGFFK